MSHFRLTPEQQQIVQAEPGHYIVTAVAGSGKTTTLAHRIHHLLNQGVDSRRILVLMFNKAAQLDFNHKLERLVQAPQTRPEVRTFHAMGYRLYQRFVQEGYLSSFHRQILTDKEVQFRLWLLINQHVEGEQVKTIKRNKKEHIETCVQFIEAVKSGLHPPELVFEQLNLNDKFRYVVELFGHFEQWRKQQSRISYADMLYEPVKALINHPELVDLVANKMDVILVDEYQDTNDIQHALLKLIAGDRAKITIVGDPDQTIYEFRGAKPEYMIGGFSSEFPEAKHLSLSYSFRYGHGVALLANHLISKNKSRRDLLCKAHEDNPNTSVLTHDRQQDLIPLLSGLPKEELNQTAILLRVWSQSVGIELALLSRGLPYQMAGHPGIFHSDEARSILAILEIASGVFGQSSEAHRQQSIEGLLKFPHVGLADHQLREIAASLSRFDDRWGLHLLQLIPDSLKKIQSIKLERMARALSGIEKSNKALRVLFREYVAQTELFEGIRSLSLSVDQGEEKIASIQGMIQFVVSQKGTPIEVLTTLQQLQKTALERKEEGIHLSTIHRAKGLEWRHVLIPGLQDKVYPYVHQRESVMTKQYLESERRLLYVAMTRAIESLHLFMPKSKGMQVEQSRFQNELNLSQSVTISESISQRDPSDNISCQFTPSKTISRYLNELGIALNVTKANSSLELDATPDSPVWFSERVRHSMLGEGQVIDEQGSSFTVKFSDQQNMVFSKETAHRFFVAI